MLESLFNAGDARWGARKPVRSALVIVPLLSTLGLVAGCGAARVGMDTAPRSQEAPKLEAPKLEAPKTEAAPVSADTESRSTDAWPTQTMRIVQSVYFESLKNDLASAIGDKLAKAPRGIAPGVAFSPASPYAATGMGTNALTVLNKLPEGRGILVVHLGHQKTEQYSIQDWAKQFYSGLFASNWSKAYFEISPGNEYDLKNAPFDATMKSFTDELIKQWNAGKETKGKPFPYAHLHLLQYNLVGSRTTNGFTVDGEYHLPSAGDSRGNPATSLPSGYTFAGNDGQTLSSFPASNAKTGGDLLMIEASKYFGFCKGKGASLWLPPLHRWAYNTSSKKYVASDTRVDPTGEQRTRMIDRIDTFVNTP